MSSGIDATKPASGSATTLSVRDNFTAAKSEIEAIQGENSIYSVAASVAANALTFELKDSAGADATSTTGIDLTFRSSTATSGLRVKRQVTAALSAVVPQGATLGFSSSETATLYIYALDNSGTVELAISNSTFDEQVLQSTTALTASSDSATVLYSTTARSNVPVKLIGAIRIQTGATAGDWSNAPTRLETLGSNSKTVDEANVNITGGSISGITDLAVADGGTGASTAATARTNLGLGSAAVEDVGTSANNVVQLNGSAELPAVSGANLTNLPDNSEFTSQFVSAEQTITSAGSLTLAHSLGAMPKLVQARIICKTAEHGYSVGDEIIVGNQALSNPVAYGQSIVPDATNLNIRYGSASGVYLVHNFTTGVNFVATNANWKLILRAWV